MTYKYKLLGDHTEPSLVGQPIEFVIRKEDGAWIPKDSNNRDYQQFLQDVKEQGLNIIEGPDVTTPDYKQQRILEYPPIEEQLDKIYHSGVDAWKADIKLIKDKYPKTITGGSTVGDVPSWVQTEVNILIKNDYVRAIERLKRPKVALGVKVLIADNYWDPELMKVIENEKYVYQNVPDPEDPRVLDDEKARSAAQAVIDATPQSIIDSINT